MIRLSVLYPDRGRDLRPRLLPGHPRPPGREDLGARALRDRQGPRRPLPRGRALPLRLARGHGGGDGLEGTAAVQADVANYTNITPVLTGRRGGRVAIRRSIQVTVSGGPGSRRRRRQLLVRERGQVVGTVDLVMNVHVATHRASWEAPATFRHRQDPPVRYRVRGNAIHVDGGCDVKRAPNAGATRKPPVPAGGHEDIDD